MNSTPRTLSPSAARATPLVRDAIEWEELPSLAASLTRRLVVRGQRPGAHGADLRHSAGFASPWDATMPAPLEPTPEPEPFREALHGLITRELREPEVFRHFFLSSAGTV